MIDMRKYFRNMSFKKVMVLIFFSLSIVLVNPVSGASVPDGENVDLRENVLIIHSYNHGFSWTDELNRGITEKLSDEQYNIYTEYLDAYRVNPTDYYKIETIKSYASKDISYIVVTDNTAFELILALKKEYFPDTPVLFAGVNGGILPDEAFNDVKGILQNVDYEDFLLWFNENMPEVKDLLLCGAKKSTTEGTYDQIMETYTRLGEENFNFQIHLVQTEDYDEVIDIITAYDPLTTAIYSTGSFGVLNHDQYTDMLETNSNMPTFCGVSTSITNQVIGGFVVSPYEHGQILGDDILRLSRGQSIESLPIIEEPVQQIIYNYNGIKKYHISESSLPQNSMIINKPNSSFILTLNQVILMISMVVILVVIITALIIINTNRKKAHRSLTKANKALLESKLELESNSEKLMESQSELTQNYDLLVCANQKIINLLDHNQVTGSLNEIKFLSLLETNFPADKNITILNITITNLNELTFTHGKKIYISILNSIASYLQEITQENDLIGLSSNNDFLIAAEGKLRNDSKLLKQITEFFETPLISDLFTVILKYKIGIAYYPVQTNSFTELLYYSRLAITPIIENSLNNISIYEQSIMENINHENCIKNEIEIALKDQEFILYYQPKYAIDGVTILGLEALIRWNHKDGSIKSPGYFIDITEQSGQIINIGFYVIEAVCQDMIEYDLIKRKIPVAINLSGHHFASKDIVHKLMATIKKYKIPPNLLELEITETAVIQNKEFGAVVLSELRELGFIITLDDFGTGYASIDYIKNLPIDKLKIDQSFASRLEDIKAQNLLKTMIQMAHELSFVVTVEGIETTEQFDIIKAFEPEEFQGYLFQRPVPLEVLFKKE